MTISPSTDQTELRQALFDRLATLPQWPQVDPGDADAWVTSLLHHQPHRAHWHVDRLFGFTGSEIGALSGTAASQLHPFHAADRLVRSKLLQDPIAPPNADEARAMAMEPQLCALYRSRLAARGGRVCDDLLEQVMAHALQSGGWRVGNPPEIVEENGKHYLVNYQCPGEAVETEYAIDGVPYYLRAQLHHYLAMATNAGVKIDGLRLCSLDFRAWDVDERQVDIDPKLSEQVAVAGEQFWTGHVLTGIPAEPVRIQRADTLDQVRLGPSLPSSVPAHDLSSRQETGKQLAVAIGPDVPADPDELRAHIEQRAREFLAWGLVESEGNKMREMLQQSLAAILPAEAVPLGVDRIDTGHVRLRVDRELDEQALIKEAMRLLKETGYSEQAAHDYLAQPNFWQPSEFSAEALLEVIRQETDLDPENDPRFAGAKVKAPSRRLEPLLEMIKEMGGTDLDLARFVKGGRVRMEMPRFPLVGPLSDLRSQSNATIRRQLGEPLREIANDLIERRSQIQAQALAAKHARRRRPSGG